MQYALLESPNPENDYCFLVDANELKGLFDGLDYIVQNDVPDDETTLPLTLVYGVYMPQPFFEFPKSEIRRNILKSVNHWLTYLKGNTVVYCGLEDIELLDITVMKSCGHCPRPHASNDVAFAALMRIPQDLKLGNGKTQAKTVFLRWHDMDVLTNLINRDGLFSLIAPEKRIKEELDSNNWKTFIDYQRAARYAQKFR
ncbi:hypothetical protein [Photobacterium damselae]|uniref:hypothetical protein n=1 Tax=Photobacterium damselae TaxID=38293 RepID=UPI0035A8C476